MMNIKREQLKKLKITFRRNEVVFAYLFGSQATGKAAKNSDFDFAVMLSEKMNDKKRFDIRLKIFSEASRILKSDKIEVVVLNDEKSPLLKFVIIKEGKVVFEKDHPARVDFEFRTMNEYYDFSRFLEAYNDAYLQRQLMKIKAK